MSARVRKAAGAAADVAEGQGDWLALLLGVWTAALSVPS